MKAVSAVTDAGTKSHQLVEHLTRLTAKDLGPSVMREARIRLLDGLGCAFYGTQMPWGKIAADVAYAEKAVGGATVCGRTTPTAPTRAAFCNGTAIHGIELDDIAEGAQVHPGAVVISAALAAAEHCNASGANLLIAIVAGYEAMARLGRAMGELSWNFHITGVAGPVGATVAAGMLMGLQQEQVMRAIGIACSCSAGIKAFTQGSGGMVKRMHAGRAAESGVLACLLAQRGFTGPTAAIDGPFGLLEAFGGAKVKPEALVNDLGRNYVVSHIWTKVYACCGRIASTAQAVKALREAYQLKPSMIEKIRVGAHSSVVGLNGAVSPQETMAAQYSLPFVTGVALTGDPMNPRCFEGHALEDPVVRDMARRVDLYNDAEMEALHPIYGTKVELHLKNGETLRTMLKDAQGTPNAPCTEDEIEEKFRCLAGALLSPEAVNSVIDIVARTEQLPSIAPLSAALRGSE